MSLGKKVFSSAFLLFLRKIWGNIINLFVMAVLARLLSKEDFGLLAISSVFLSIINTLATSGIAEYLVYYDGEDRAEKVNAAFWLNLLLTLAVIAIVVSVGPFWAEFYDNTRIYPLLLLLAVSFFFEMCSTVPRSILRKELEYKTLVFYSTVAMTLVSVGKLTAAWTGFGIYSLALPQAIVSPVLMFCLFYKTKFKPFSRLGFAHFKSIIDYTKHIIGGRVLTRLVNEGDNLIVGKLIGLEGLGIYSLAFQLANLVTSNVVVLVNDLFLPLLSKVKGDIERLRSIYLRMVQFLSFVSFPLITFLAIAADPIIFFIYGEKWTDAIIPFQILCAFALARSISSPSSSLFSAMGKPEIGFKFTACFTPIFLLAVLAGSQAGVVGVALATSVVRVAGSIVSLHLSLSLLHLSLIDLYSSIKSSLLAMALITGMFFLGIVHFIDHSVTLLFIGMPILFYAYFLFQRIFFPADLDASYVEIKKYVPLPGLIIIFQKMLFLNSAK
jgi:teichuronic acid exporter